LKPSLKAATSAPVTPVSTPVATTVVTPLAKQTATHATPTALPTGRVLPADEIKGKNTLKKVSDQYAVPLDKLLAGLKLDPKTDPNTAIKELIAQGKFTEVTDVQKVLAALQAK
jgi:hypothetical protein